MKKISAIIAAAAMIFTFTACTSLDSTKEEKEIVMTVGKYEVPFEMLRYTALNSLNAVVSSRGIELTDEFTASDEGKKLNEEILSSATEQLKTIYGIFELGETYGIDRLDDTFSSIVDMKMKEAEAQYESKKDFKEYLTSSYMTRDVMRVTNEFTEVYDEIYNRMIDSGEIVTDEDKLISIFESGEMIRIKELCFSTERHTIEECRSLAEKRWKQSKTVRILMNIYRRTANLSPCFPTATDTI